MPKAAQARRMLMPRTATAFLAISLRRDGATTFLQRLLDDLGLEPFLGVHLLQAAVLLLQLLEPGHQRGVHPTVLRPPLVEGGPAHPMLPAQLRPGVPASACFRILRIWLSLNFDFFYAESPLVIIRENSTFVHRWFSGGLSLAPILASLITPEQLVQDSY